MIELGPIVIARPLRLHVTTLLVIAAMVVVLAVLAVSHYGPQSEAVGTVIGPEDFRRYGVDAESLSAVTGKLVVFRMPLRYARTKARISAVAIELPDIIDGQPRYIEGEIVSIRSFADSADAGRDADPVADRHWIECLVVIAFRPNSRWQQQIDSIPVHSVVTVRTRAQASSRSWFDPL